MEEETVEIYRGSPQFSLIKIRRGDSVVIKPNLVKECKESDESEWRSVVTDPSLIKSVCEYVCQQLDGTGSLTICDAPQTDSSFRKIVERLDLLAIQDYCQKKYAVRVELVDLRSEEWENLDGVIVRRTSLTGDPKGVVRFNLAQDSFFFGYRGEGRYYGADYDSTIVNMHHQGDCQEYLICGTPIMCDVFINMPKLKTHKKTGVTISLKNLVGINADKNWLPHHTDGCPSSGGDEYPNLTVGKIVEGVCVKFARKLAMSIPILGSIISRRLRTVGTVFFGSGSNVIRSGNWYGNDTTWRMVLDLNRCLLYGKPDGSFRTGEPKRYYSVVDGIIGMDGNGPMQGNPVNSGVVLVGCDPVAVDAVAATLMGFDWRKLPTIREAFGDFRYPITQTCPDKIKIRSDVNDWNGTLEDLKTKETFMFEPHFGWKGHIERRLLK